VSSKDWYDVKVLRAKTEESTATLSYRAHYGAIVKAFEALGIRAKAKTHASRGSGARMAEVAGATEAQIRRLGRWNNNTMEGCYLTALPREAMRSLAGFPPGLGAFYLPRAAVQPGDALLKRVFPEVDRWLEAQETGLGCEPNIAAGEF
jgi:Centromere DNA-binding protein complex CBF3 subunit, domain 2